MKSKLSTLASVLILSALIFSGCAMKVPVEASEHVRAARDAALAYISEHYGEQTPAPGSTWTEERPLQQVPGQGECWFTAEGWVVTILYAVVPPEWTVYQVTVANRTTGFQWEGKVDAVGHVVEPLAPEEVRSARDAALAYVFYHYDEEPARAPGRIWTEKRTTPEGLVGSETLEFTTGDWVVTVSYPIVAPEAVVYQIVAANESTGFWWEGEVDAAGQVTELSASTEPTVEVRDPGRALEIALAYLSEHYSDQAPAAGLTWVGDRPPPEEPVGGETFEFTSESAPDWVVTVSYVVVAREDLVFQVVVANETTGFRWEGEVDASGQVTEKVAPR